MIKVIIILLLSLLSGTAFAEWVPIAAIHSQESPETQTAYVDAATVQKNGNVVNMAVLVDHQSGLSKGVESSLDKLFFRAKGDITKSWKVQDEFDCTNKQLRMLSHTLLAGFAVTSQSLLLCPRLKLMPRSVKRLPKLFLAFAL